MRRLLETLMAGFLALTVGCASSSMSKSSTSTQFVPFQHVAALPTGEHEHDAVFYPDGERDFYPNQQEPRRAVMHPTAGGTLDLLCMNDDCTELLVRSAWLKDVQDGSFELVQIYQRIALVRDGVSEKNIGYLAQNEAGEYGVAHTLENAQAAAHPTESGTSKALKSAGSGTAKGLKIAGKIALGAVVVTAVVAGALAEGMAQARENAPAAAPVYVAPPRPTFTNCSQLVVSLSLHELLRIVFVE
jgi:hypothetical protein